MLARLHVLIQFLVQVGKGHLLSGVGSKVGVVLVEIIPLLAEPAAAAISALPKAESLLVAWDEMLETLKVEAGAAAWGEWQAHALVAENKTVRQIARKTLIF